MARVDCLQRIITYNDGRDPARLRRKYAAMRADAFAFLRGTCHLFYEDWPPTSPLNEAPQTWICGDLHLENFGSYKGDNRLTYFDLTDFDEAVLAPCTWDLARFLTSVWVGAHILQIEARLALALCTVFLQAYTAALVDGKARWVERATARGMVRDLLRGLRKRRRAVFLDSRTEWQGRKRRLRLDGKRALPVDDQDRTKVAGFMRRFAATQADPTFFQVRDVARRIAGTGSLGLERYVILVHGRSDPDENFLLDLKWEPGSALAPYVPALQPGWPHEAERVVAIQQRVQAITPAFLQTVTIGARSYVLRELLPSQDRLHLAHWHGQSRRLEQVLDVMGKLVAWGHLRSGGRQGSATSDTLITFASQAAWQQPLLEYAISYSAQVVHDWQRFCEESLCVWATHLRRCFKGVDTVLDESIPLHWLRVFGDAEASRMGQGGGHQRHTSAVRSEKGGDSVAAEGTGMRVIATFFGPYAPDALPAHV